MSKVRALTLALSTAVLLTLSQEPFAWWPLAFVALVPLLFLADARMKPLARYLVAYLGGCAVFVGGCHWLAITTPLNLILMVVFEALAIPAFICLYRTMRLAKAPVWIAVALAWVAIEFTRSYVPWNGFPWLLLGNSLVPASTLSQAADLVGVYGLSFLIAVVNGLLYGNCLMPRRRWWPAVASIGALFLVLYGYGWVRIEALTGSGRPGPTIAIVQANVPQNLKEAVNWEMVVARQMQTTKEAITRAGSGGFDIVCWAETMFLGALPHGDDEQARDADRESVADPLIRPWFGPMGAWFLFGAATYSGNVRDPDHRYNAVLLFDPEGNRVGEYDKTVLVPGGEFLPMLSLLPEGVVRFIHRLAGYVPDLTAGEGPRPFVLETRDGASYRFATTICYENVYSAYTASAAALGVDFLVNLSNEAWFVESAEFDQMEAASRLRAIECRRSLVRVTNSGISAIYDAMGQRIAVITGPGGVDRAVSGILLAQVPIYRAHSPYVALGVVFPFFLTLMALIWGGVGMALRVSRYSKRPRK